MKRFGLLAVVFAVTGLCFLPPIRSAEPASPPRTAKKPVTDTFQGVKVTEDYRWLEDTSDPTVRRWVKEQNRYTRAVLNKYPALKPVRRRLAGLLLKAPPHYEQLIYQRKLLFALKDGILVTLSGPDNLRSERVVVDPDKLLPDQDATIDYYVPSPDNRLVAVLVSTNGRENGTAYVFEVGTGKRRPELVPRVMTSGGGALAWKGDSSGFYYSRHLNGKQAPREKGRLVRQVYFHKLGTAIGADTYSLGKDFPPNGAVGLDTSKDGRYILASVSLGTENDIAYYLLGPAGRWVQVSRRADHITEADFGPDNCLYLVSQHQAPRGKILRVPLAKPQLAHAKILVPQGKGVIQGLLPTDGRLYVVDLLDGSERLRVFDLTGKESKPVPILPLSSLKQVAPLEKDEILFENETFLEPPGWYRYDPAKGKTVKTALSETSPADFRDAEVVREFATSRDGTRVPMHIIRLKDTRRDGNNPTLLTGYGGFGENELPSFDPRRRIWLDQGGVWAVAHIRGDGEYGADWHRAGRRTKRQNSFDDFAACMQRLIDLKYTRRDKLAITGASNGGLLVAAMLTQHPDRFRAAVAKVGPYDMLRLERHINGPMFIPEFGTVRDPAQFKALFAYSPYHRVQDGKAYPAVLLLTGENDTRVDPAHTWKMAARLQAATSSKLPVLLWTTPGAGHDPGPSEAAVRADEFAFLFQQLGVRYKEGGKKEGKSAKRSVRFDR
jgi:prolyl oligopeptidase